MTKGEKKLEWKTTKTMKKQRIEEGNELPRERIQDYFQDWIKASLSIYPPNLN
jgi:hypothetical protein